MHRVDNLNLVILFCISLINLVSAVLITNDSTQVANKQFSFVIVGGGTAGLALANRLSENAEWSILVIEAGPSTLNNSFVNDPGM